MKMELGKPCHGWIDLTIEDNSFKLSDSISDVPDFIGFSVTALSKLLTSENKQQIGLSLEPAYYVLTLEKDGKKFSISVELIETIDRDGLLHKFVGNFDEIIFPFFCAIQAFYIQQYKEPHWPEGNKDDIQSLSQIIEEHRHNAT